MHRLVASTFHLKRESNQNEVNQLSGLRWNLNLSDSVYIWAEQGIGDFILYCGQIGTGQMMKAFNNIIYNINS